MPGRSFRGGCEASPATLFVNVAVETLVEGNSGDRLSNLAELSGVSPSAVVLEVSERTPVSDLARLRRVVADLRKRGFRIAIDDAGAGHASMLVIAEVQPEFVKIDRLLIHGVDVSAARRALVVSLLSFGAHINARIIAEGIETEEELQTLLSLGVEFGQGWHLGRPVMVAPPAHAARRRVGRTRLVQQAAFDRLPGGAWRAAPGERGGSSRRLASLAEHVWRCREPSSTPRPRCSPSTTRPRSWRSWPRSCRP